MNTEFDFKRDFIERHGKSIFKDDEVPKGEVSQIYGGAGSGKTASLLLLLMRLNAKGVKSVYVESNFNDVKHSIPFTEHLCVVSFDEVRDIVSAFLDSDKDVLVIETSSLIRGKGFYDIEDKQTYYLELFGGVYGTNKSIILSMTGRAMGMSEGVKLVSDKNLGLMRLPKEAYVYG